MATTGGILICISTPYFRTGGIWNHYQRYYGKEDDHVLFVTGPTQCVKGPVSAARTGLSRQVVARRYI
jgi:hypothetical protein